MVRSCVRAPASGRVAAEVLLGQSSEESESESASSELSSIMSMISTGCSVVFFSFLIKALGALLVANETGAEEAERGVGAGEVVALRELVLAYALKGPCGWVKWE
jgi:hypothetical protein